MKLSDDGDEEMAKQISIQGLINQAQAVFNPPALQPSTPQNALRAEGMTLRPNGTIVPFDGVVNHDAQYGRNPKREDK